MFPQSNCQLAEDFNRQMGIQLVLTFSYYQPGFTELAAPVPSSKGQPCPR